MSGVFNPVFIRYVPLSPKYVEMVSHDSLRPYRHLKRFRTVQGYAALAGNPVCHRGEKAPHGSLGPSAMVSEPRVGTLCEPGRGRCAGCGPYCFNLSACQSTWSSMKVAMKK